MEGSPPPDTPREPGEGKVPPGRRRRRRLTIRGAAEELGTSVIAVLGRINSGTLAHEREGARTYVLLEEADEDLPPGREQPTGWPAGHTSEELATLKEQLAAEREANREKRHIIAALETRLRELEAPSEPRESPAEGAQQTPHGTSSLYTLGGGPRRGSERLRGPRRAEQRDGAGLVVA